MADIATHASKRAAMDDEPKFPSVIYVALCAGATVITAAWWVLA